MDARALARTDADPDCPLCVIPALPRPQSPARQDPVNGHPARTPLPPALPWVRWHRRPTPRRSRTRQR